MRHTQALCVTIRIVWSKNEIYFTCCAKVDSMSQSETFHAAKNDAGLVPPIYVQEKLENVAQPSILSDSASATVFHKSFHHFHAHHLTVHHSFNLLLEARNLSFPKALPIADGWLSTYMRLSPQTLDFFLISNTHHLNMLIQFFFFVNLD